MARPVDIKKKIEELRGFLIKYNGIPKQTENHAAHNNIKYYIKNHSDNPEIKALIEEFHLDDVKQRKSKEHLDIRIEDIKAILEKYHRIPKDKNEYQTVYYFFNHYKDDPDVRRLMFIYAHPDCYREIIGKALTVHSNGGGYRYLCNDVDAYKYVKYIFEEYNELPARNTAPMKKIFMEIRRYEIVRNKFRYPIEYKFKKLFKFLQEMRELGCKDEQLLEIIKE